MIFFLPITLTMHTQPAHILRIDSTHTEDTLTYHLSKIYHVGHCERRTERAKDLLDLGAVDLLAAVLVEDFEAFNVVLFASSVSGDSLRLLQNWVEVGKGDPLGTFTMNG